LNKASLLISKKWRWCPRNGVKKGNQIYLSFTVVCHFTNICDVMLTGKRRIRKKSEPAGFEAAAAAATQCTPTKAATISVATLQASLGR
jgi:hypothetical protein